MTFHFIGCLHILSLRQRLRPTSHTLCTYITVTEAPVTPLFECSFPSPMFESVIDYVRSSTTLRLIESQPPALSFSLSPSLTSRPRCSLIRTFFNLARRINPQMTRRLGVQPGVVFCYIILPASYFLLLESQKLRSLLIPALHPDSRPQP